jgi:hypothetical protein
MRQLLATTMLGGSSLAQNQPRRCVRRARPCNCTSEGHDDSRCCPRLRVATDASTPLGRGAWEGAQELVYSRLQEGLCGRAQGDSTSE